MSQPKTKKLGFPCSSDRQRATLQRAQVITNKDEQPYIRDLSVNSLLQVAIAASATYRALAGGERRSCASRTPTSWRGPEKSQGGATYGEQCHTGSLCVARVAAGELLTGVWCTEDIVESNVLS
jgi:hypothetical protein